MDSNQREEQKETAHLEKIDFQRGVRFSIAFVFLLWLIKSIEAVASANFSFLGVYPRTLTGSIGIITGPLIHGDWLHLVSNSIPLVILTVALFYFFSRIAIPVFVLIYLITGFWIWIAARDAFHIGASGVVYGLISFLMVSGFIQKDIRLLALSFATMILYGSQMVYGVFPITEGVSWESHLLGMISGTFLAFYFMPSRKPSSFREARNTDENERFIIKKSYFMYVNKFPFHYTMKHEQRDEGNPVRKYNYKLSQRDEIKKK